MGEAGDDIVVMPKLETIDVSAIGHREITGHRYYRYDAMVVYDMHELIVGNKSAEQRSQLNKKFKLGLPYWRLNTGDE